MDKALKQRLVGATVLIALAVIVLPMLLGEPPQDRRPESQQIELPPRPSDVEFETRRFPLGEPGTEAPSTTEQNRGSEQAVSAEQAPGPQQPDPGSTDGEQMDADRRLPAEAGAVPAEEAAQSEETQQLAAADAASAEQPKPDADESDRGVLPAPVVEVEPAPTITVQPDGSASTPAAGAGASGRYIVQVASLGSDVNARKLMETLQAGGFPVLLDSVESDVGRLSRVRVGPYDSEAAANDAMERIGASVEGVRPRLVDLRPEETSPVTHPADPLVRWVVQVGSFTEAANAEALVEQLRAGGLSAYRETVTSPGASVHRVRVGPFLERADAIAARQKLIDAHALQGVVMSAD